MSLSNWLCNNNASRSEFVKIVYPGGHIELHDRPVLAADIVVRNPKFCVAHPHVFQKPWAIVEPETMLMLGQKFYVVPISTVRKLQRFSLKYSPASQHHDLTSSNVGEGQDHHEEYSSGDVQMADHDYQRKEGFFSDHMKCCFHWMLKMKGTNTNSNDNNCFYWRDDQSRLSSSLSSTCETRGLMRKRRTSCSSRNGMLMMRGSPKRFASLNQSNWRPNLESVSEE